ncbi:MAG: hypothetical protein DDT28_00336 [Dehalococcoidia bacterium]|nr:hypothetical protein [Chloroflexota bacterium]
MKRKAKALSIGVGVILLGSIASSTANYEPEILPQQEAETAEPRGPDTKALQDVVAKSVMVLTIDSLRMALGTAFSADDIDAVTAPSMRYR